MSDSELIIRLLKKTERRIHRNRMLHELASGLAISLLFPVLFKFLDFYFPFRLSTVSTFFVIWAIGTAAWILWQIHGLGEPLQKTAADIDRTSQGHDQLKTAYWFIRHPKDSPWIDLQIRQAAASAKSLPVNTLFPRRLPRASFAAIGLIFALGLLNFLPLPGINNWFRLEGAPAFALDDALKAALERALELLKEADKLQDTDLAERLAQLIQSLKDGSMSKDEFSRSLSEIQQALAEQGLDAGRMMDGLERIAKALDPSQYTKPVATEIFSLKLNDAAEEVRNIAKNLDTAPDAKLREMAARFQEASDVAGQGLEKLSEYLSSSANAMNRRDTSAGQRALEQTAKELERLQRILESQRMRAEANSELGEVAQSVGGTPGELGGDSQAPGQGEGEGVGQGEGEGGEGQPGARGQGRGEGQGEGEGEGQGEGEGEGQGDQPGNGGGQGGKEAGRSGPMPMRGEPTSLDTELEKSPIPVKPTRGSRPETLEEASQRERSKLDYRNVQSNLTPAQKDTLNQDPIPYEQRQFVKEYMESLRP